jgi:hypothetical protein
MDADLQPLFDKLRALEEELEQKVQARAQQFHYRLERNKAIFEREALERHRRIKMRLSRFLWESPFLTYLTAPVIYSMIIPLALLDLSIIIYQHTCFVAWGVKRVKRRDYIVIDRHRLAYLNSIEKLNCVYCGYANGLIALVREVASRTEQYWCPIRHALKVKGAHSRYRNFVDYGDAEGFRERLESLREELKKS